MAQNETGLEITYVLSPIDHPTKKPSKSLIESSLEKSITLTSVVTGVIPAQLEPVPLEFERVCPD